MAAMKRHERYSHKTRFYCNIRVSQSNISALLPIFIDIMRVSTFFLLLKTSQINQEFIVLPRNVPENTQINKNQTLSVTSDFRNLRQTIKTKRSALTRISGTASSTSSNLHV